jgi:hypothetical protein
VGLFALLFATLVLHMHKNKIFTLLLGRFFTMMMLRLPMLTTTTAAAAPPVLLPCLSKHLLLQVLLLLTVSSFLASSSSHASTSSSSIIYRQYVNQTCKTLQRLPGLAQPSDTVGGGGGAAIQTEYEYEIGITLTYLQCQDRCTQLGISCLGFQISSMSVSSQDDDDPDSVPVGLKTTRCSYWNYLPIEFEHIDVVVADADGTTAAIDTATCVVKQFINFNSTSCDDGFYVLPFAATTTTSTAEDGETTATAAAAAAAVTSRQEDDQGIVDTYTNLTFDECGHECFNRSTAGLGSIFSPRPPPAAFGNDSSRIDSSCYGFQYINNTTGTECQIWMTPIFILSTNDDDQVDDGDDDQDSGEGGSGETDNEIEEGGVDSISPMDDDGDNNENLVGCNVRPQSVITDPSA